MVEEARVRQKQEVLWTIHNPKVIKLVEINKR